jgi:uncharacterized membrane protein
MPWLKLLHISAVILWCGSLLYLAGAIAAAARPPPPLLDAGGPRVLRILFTLVAGPAALAAIASGTAIFVLHGPHAMWLLAKLAVVALLVLGHAACGMLILRIERGLQQRVRAFGATIGLTSVLWLGAIAWLVLRKPF